jgi:hypothetical protein
MSDKKANSNKFEIDVNLIKAFFINILFGIILRWFRNDHYPFPNHLVSIIYVYENDEVLRRIEINSYLLPGFLGFNKKGQ